MTVLWLCLLVVHAVDPDRADLAATYWYARVIVCGYRVMLFRRSMLARSLQDRSRDEEAVAADDLPSYTVLSPPTASRR